MADDRLQLRCDFCGGWVTLMRYSMTHGLGMERVCGSPTHMRLLMEWIDTHAQCHPRAQDCKHDLGGVAGWSLVPESLEPLHGDRLWYVPESDNETA